MGAARGLDEGLIGTSAEQPSFQRIFGLDEASGKTEEEIAATLGNITGMVQMGSILGALIAFYLTDKIGRLWATRYGKMLQYNATSLLTLFTANCAFCGSSVS
jgi:MFS family permease